MGCTLPKELTISALPPLQITMASKIKASTREMDECGKMNIMLDIIDTDSKSTDHKGIDDDVAAHIHLKLSEVAENEVPIKAIRVYYTKFGGGRSLKLQIPECFQEIDVVDIIGTFMLQAESTGHKYQIKAKEGLTPLRSCA